jgi:hypothetical protein
VTVQSQAALPFATRVWFAYVAFFKILFDGLFAARVREVEQLPAGRAPLASLPEKTEAAPPPKVEPVVAPPPPPAPPPAPPAPVAPNNDAALALLALFQREGRLIDFLEQDIAGFGDADIGAAVRVVHEGCRRALRTHVTIAPVRSEDEGARVTIAPGDAAPEQVTLTGNVGGKGPYTGTLRHRGWKATSLSLPEAAPGHDAHLLAAAEVEL